MPSEKAGKTAEIEMISSRMGPNAGESCEDVEIYSCRLGNFSRSAAEVSQQLTPQAWFFPATLVAKVVALLEAAVTDFGDQLISRHGSIALVTHNFRPLYRNCCRYGSCICRALVQSPRCAAIWISSSVCKRAGLPDFLAASWWISRCSSSHLCNVPFR